MLDYKRIIKQRKTRIRILQALNFVPDKIMIKLQYFIKTGRRLNLKDPKRFTEKLQWYKIYYRDPLMVKCVDKYDVREYVKDKGLEDILIPCYGVFDSVEEIDWKELPNSFVMKDTLGGGGTSVIIVKDKSKADLSVIRTRAAKWVARDISKKTSGREWPYNSGKKHRIIIEKYLEPDSLQKDLIDYKFFCFGGKCKFLYIMGERKVGERVKVSIYDREFNLLPVKRIGDEPYRRIEKPNNYNTMLTIAETLASDFPHVRVDLFNVDSHVRFGELTFFNASGYMKYEPDSFDTYVGGLWKL